MKTFTLILFAAMSSLASAQDQLPPPVHGVQHTNKYQTTFCNIGTDLINTYGSAYLKHGNNRPVLCADLGLGAAHSRGIMAPDVGLDVRQRYIGAQQEICEFTVQGTRLGISLTSLIEAFSTLCRNGRPTAIDGNLADIVTIETMLEARTGQ